MSDQIPSKRLPWPMLFAHCGASLALFLILVKAVPGFVSIFDDFEAELPFIAQLVISFSYVAVHYWYLLPFALIVDAAVLFGLGRLPPRARWLATWWFWLVLVAIILLIGSTIVGVGLPFMNLLERIESS